MGGVAGRSSNVKEMGEQMVVASSSSSYMYLSIDRMLCSLTILVDGVR
jgi:hypothetical protein